MSVAEEIAEKVDVGLDSAVPCSGRVQALGGNPNALEYEDCAQAATWRLTLSCCRQRSLLKCTEHRAKILRVSMMCRICDKHPIEGVWTEL